jgi:hypothetical protein
LYASIRVSLSISIGDTYYTVISVSLSAIVFGVRIGIGIGDTIFDGIAIDYRHTFKEYR